MLDCASVSARDASFDLNAFFMAYDKQPDPPGADESSADPAAAAAAEGAVSANPAYAKAAGAADPGAAAVELLRGVVADQLERRVRRHAKAAEGFAKRRGWLGGFTATPYYVVLRGNMVE